MSPHACRYIHTKAFTTFGYVVNANLIKHWVLLGPIQINLFSSKSLVYLQAGSKILGGKYSPSFYLRKYFLVEQSNYSNRTVIESIIEISFK